MSITALDVSDAGIDEAQRLISKITIPAQPQVVIDLQREMASPQADFPKIARSVATDAALSARIIKLINSPLYGLSRPVTSISQALSLLGLKNFNSIVLSSAMRDVIKVEGGLNEKFWEHTQLMARLCEIIAQRTRLVSPDLAYMVGLFHDCAVPLMLNRFPGYEGLAFPEEGGGERDVISTEDELYNTNHAMVGYLIAKNWALPLAVALAIRYHHEPSLDHILDDSARILTATLLFADFISTIVGSSVSLNSADESVSRWEQRNHHILIELGLSCGDIHEYCEDVAELLISS